MKIFSKLIAVTCFSLTALSYAQSEGFEQYPQQYASNPYSSQPQNYSAGQSQYDENGMMGGMMSRNYSSSDQPYSNGQSYSSNQPYTTNRSYSSNQPYASGQSYSSSQSYNQPYSSSQPYMSNSQGSVMKSSDQMSKSSWFGGSSEPTVPDEMISSNVMQNLRNTPYLSNAAKNLQVTTKDGKVTLKGMTANKNERNMIEYMVKNVEGVKSVSNDMQTEK